MTNAACCISLLFVSSRRATEPQALAVLKTGFEDDTYWHMVRDGLIQFVWYLTGPLITTVWELIGVARSSEENRRQTDAGTHTHLQLFLFY